MMSRCSGCPLRTPVEYSSLSVELYGTFRNLLRSSFYSHITRDRTQAGTRSLGVVFFLLMVFGEVKHIVHLIRWNLKAVLCQLGQDLTTGLEWHNARPIGLGAESCCFTNCFGFLVCHQLVPHLVPNFPACLSVMCRGV